MRDSMDELERNEARREEGRKSGRGKRRDRGIKRQKWQQRDTKRKE